MSLFTSSPSARPPALHHRTTKHRADAPPRRVPRDRPGRHYERAVSPRTASTRAAQALILAALIALTILGSVALNRTSTTTPHGTHPTHSTP